MNKQQPLNLTEGFKFTVQAFANTLLAQQEAAYLNTYCEGQPFSQLDPNRLALVRMATAVKVTFGKTWVKVDVGGAGRYMVNSAGDIFGVKAYGVPHLGHRFGNLNTITAWYWGGYSASLRA